MSSERRRRIIGVLMCAAVAAPIAAGARAATPSPATICAGLPSTVATKCRAAAEQCETLAQKGFSSRIPTCLSALEQAMNAIRGRTGTKPATTTTGSTSSSSLSLLPAGPCSALAHGTVATPQLLIASDLPLQGAHRTVAVEMSEAIEFILKQHNYRAGNFTLGYQSCDATTASARTYAQDKSLVGLIGSFDSTRDRALVPTLEGGSLGPVGIVGVEDGYVGLTHSGPGTLPSEPGVYYPRHVRALVRVYPADDSQAAADAMLAVNVLNASSVYVLDDGTRYGIGFAKAFEAAVRALGGTVAGSSAWNPSASSYATLASTVHQSGAQVVFLGGSLASNGGKLVRDLRFGLGNTAALIAPDGFGPVSGLVAAAGSSADGLFVSDGGVPNSALGTGGKAFVSAFEAAHGGTEPDPASVRAAQAADVLLDAIARSHGTRESISSALFATRIANGILGSFSFDTNGDIILDSVTSSKIVGGKETTYKVITPPRSLVTQTAGGATAPPPPPAPSA